MHQTIDVIANRLEKGQVTHCNPLAPTRRPTLPLFDARIVSEPA
jgi:hypothetical protein